MSENSGAKKPKKEYKKSRIIICLLAGFFFMLILNLFSMSTKEAESGSITYKEFQSDVTNGYIESVIYNQSKAFVEVVYKEGVAQDEVLDEKTGEIRELEIKDNKRIETVINPADENFFKNLAESDVNILYKSNSSVTLLITILTQIPYFLLIGIMIWYFSKSFGGGMKQTKKSVKSDVKFEDIAGMKEEKDELLFSIKSLKNISDYLSKGVQPIKGILLEGPPGVGKTLLAKAVAGEAGVNFLSYSGSDFVEMFAGLGARRVRNMYEEAEKLKPCVIFIDEIDALGRKRISGGNGGTQEADQTLVALLERMDGMNSASGILFIGATNRIDALDSALLRPGRFDKIIHIGPPRTKEEREAIVEVHSKSKSFNEGVTFEKIAKQCYGLTGAEIASVLNDSVLESFKNDRNGVISLDDIDKAIMKLLAKGLAKGRHNERDLYRTSVHEAGHTLMNLYLGRSVVKVSTQPYSSGVGGATTTDGESVGMEGLRTKTDLINDIKVLYAGKVAEEVIFGECSIGASNDLERATYMLRDYIGAYGMADSLLSLVGLSKENIMISANDDLLLNMNKEAKVIYDAVMSIFTTSSFKAILKEMSDELTEKEVLYDFSKYIVLLEQLKDNI